LNCWIGWTVRAGLSGACPVAAALFGLGGMPGAVRKSVVTIEYTWRITFIQLIDSAKANRDLVDTVDSQQVAWNLLGAYLAHHVSAHILRDPDADRKATASVEQLLGTLFGVE
jgi:hypothetical protein